MVQVWDLSKSRSLEAAAALLEESAFTQNSSDMALVLAAAANCSSGARHTPLHAAVEAGCKYSVKVSVLPALPGSDRGTQPCPGCSLALAHHVRSVL